MTYGTKEYKNGKKVGYLIFNSGKRVFLNSEENIDFQNKAREYEYAGKLKQKYNK